MVVKWACLDFFFWFAKLYIEIPHMKDWMCRIFGYGVGGSYLKEAATILFRLAGLFVHIHADTDLLRFPGGSRRLSF